MGTLFDMVVSDGAINVQDRDDMGTGHGWAGANQVFWNCKGSSSICQNPWTSAKNYNFGFMGGKEPGARAGRPDGEWVGHNEPGIFPSSLYEAQLSQRIDGKPIFSAISQLDQISDSVFRMSFTLPLNSSQLINENFKIGGSAGIENKLFTIDQEDEFSILIAFSGLGILPAFSTIVVEARNLSSKDGIALEGLTEARFTEPDKRPLVTGLELSVDNETGFVVASSSKTGYIYLVKYGSEPQSKSDLDSLVELNQGRRVEAPQQEVSVPLYTNGLPGGFYNYYAVDEDERVSPPGIKWVTIKETGPVLGIKEEASLNQFRAYHFNGKIVVDPVSDEHYALEIFSLSGSLMYRENHLQGIRNISLDGMEGFLLIRMRSDSKVSTLKISSY
jgi:hypothetical protein